MAGRLSTGQRFLIGDKLCTAEFLFGAIVLNVVYNELIEKTDEIDYPLAIYEQHEVLIKYAESLKSELGSYLERRQRSSR